MPQNKNARSRSFVQAREACTGSHDGEVFVLTPGEVFAADHPIVRTFPHYFAPLAASRPDVEQTTAAPGERR